MAGHRRRVPGADGARRRACPRRGWRDRRDAAERLRQRPRAPAGRVRRRRERRVLHRGARPGRWRPHRGGPVADRRPVHGLGSRGHAVHRGLAHRSLSGDGSPGNPWRLTTAFTAGSVLQVSEIVQYVNGTNDVTVTYSVGPLQTPGVNVRLYESASVLPAGELFRDRLRRAGPAAQSRRPGPGSQRRRLRQPRGDQPVVALPGGGREHDRQRGEQHRSRACPGSTTRSSRPPPTTARASARSGTSGRWAPASRRPSR